jgi:hypothetical protein
VPTKLYRYVHVADDGIAPAVDAGLITLATCKPVIRRCASPGDWVMGFYPAPAEPGILSWAARIERKMDHGSYEAAFHGRSDAVYRLSPRGHLIRLRPDYHADPKDWGKDIGAPVLIFEPDRSWYFGDQPLALPSDLIHLAARGEGHRVNGRRAGDEALLASWLRQQCRPGVHGRPRHRADALPCGGCRRSPQMGC